jgi:hypothetical protein
LKQHLVKFLFGKFIIACFYEYFNRLPDIHPYLWHNLGMEYLSPEAVYRSAGLGAEALFLEAMDKADRISIP